MTIEKRLRALVALITACLAAACNVGPLPEAPEGVAKQSLDNAPLASASARPWAAYVHTVHSNGEVEECTGALIAPNLVLTAQQCGICAASVTVSLHGDLGASPPVPLVYTGTSTSLAPGSLRSSLDCSLSGTGFRLLTAQIDGRGLALVQLNASSSHPPVKVLTRAPYGFSPVQDLAGAPVAVLGRGFTEFFGSFGPMREGQVHINHYSNTLIPFCFEAIDAFHMAAWDAQSAAFAGDDGAPWLATVDGEEQLIGILTSPSMGIADAAAPTFTFSNATYLRSALGLPNFDVDADGDDVQDALDNCPLDANRDQVDRDLDGVGDVCDNCRPSGVLDMYDPTVGTFPELWNPDQKNCNQEAEDTAVLAEFPAFASGGAPRHITDADYVESSGGSSICDTAMRAIRRQRRGDKCDPVPCAKTSTKTGSTEGAFGASQPVACGVGGWPGVGMKSVAATNGFELQGKKMAGAQTGDVGLRWCACAQPHATQAERRLNCSAGPAQCAIDATQYQLSHPKWKRLDLEPVAASGDTLTSVTFPGGTSSVKWDYLSDLVALTGTSLPMQPWTLEPDGTILNGPKLRGILWSRVTRLAGTDITAVPDDDFRNFSVLANSYREGDHRFSSKTSCKRIPRLKANPWWKYCGPCELELGNDWLEVVNPGTAQEQWLGVGITSSTDVSWAIEAGARDLLRDSTLQLVNAGEAGQGRTFEDGLPLAVVTKARTLEVVGTLHSMSGKLGGRRIGSVAQPLSVGETALPVFSAVRQELFALRRLSGRVSLQSQRLGGAWSQLPLRGAALVNPVAVTFGSDGQTLWLLDEVTTGTVQLCRLDVSSGLVTVVVPRLLDGSFTALSLTFRESGRLLVAGGDARDQKTWAVHLDVSGRTPMLVDRASLASLLMQGTASVTEKGDVAFMVKFTDGVEGRLLTAGDFRPVNAAITGPVF